MRAAIRSFFGRLYERLDALRKQRAERAGEAMSRRHYQGAKR